MIKFGTGGFRAVMGVDYTKENVQKVIQSMSNDINKNNLTKEVFVGYDNRFMSEFYCKWVAEVFAGNGIKVTLMNKPSVTPVTNYYAKKHNLDYVICVTASHNPAIYNGIKVFTFGGRDALPEQTKGYEKESNAMNINEVKVFNFDDAVEEGLINLVNIEQEYLDSLLSLVKIDKTPKIAFDAMYGSAADLLKNFGDTLGLDYTILHDERDTMFGGHMPSPLPETLPELTNLMKTGNYDLGLALDGDGDRLAIINNKGAFIDNNALMACLYYFMNKYKGIKGNIVKTISTTNLLDILAEKFDSECHTVNVGMKFVAKEMLDVNAILGGEASGGLAIPEHIMSKDSLLSITLLLEMMSVMGKTLNQIIDEVYEFANFSLEYVEKQYSFDARRKEEIVNTLLVKQNLPNFDKTVEKVVCKDYLKVFFTDGTWCLIRFSGTEPVIRFYAETESQQKGFELAQNFVDFLNI